MCPDHGRRADFRVGDAPSRGIHAGSRTSAASQILVVLDHKYTHTAHPPAIPAAPAIPPAPAVTPADDPVQRRGGSRGTGNDRRSRQHHPRRHPAAGTPRHPAAVSGEANLLLSPVSTSSLVLIMTRSAHHRLPHVASSCLTGRSNPLICGQMPAPIGRPAVPRGDPRAALIRIDLDGDAVDGPDRHRHRRVQPGRRAQDHPGGEVTPPIHGLPLNGPAPTEHHLRL